MNACLKCIFYFFLDVKRTACYLCDMLVSDIFTIYTCWTAPSLTFDLLCGSRLMFDEAKLSPTSASICTTNRMLGEALSNKCFIMPKSLNDNIKNWVCFGQILSCSDDKHFQDNYILNTCARWISNLLLCTDWLTDSTEKVFSDPNSVVSTKGKHRKEVPSLSLHNNGKWIIYTGHEAIPRT